MEKYKLNIFFSQNIYREVEAESKEEAERMGYDIAKEVCEVKAINVDVDVLPEEEGSKK